MVDVRSLSVELPTGQALRDPSPPSSSSPQTLILSLQKQSKGRCGLTLHQAKTHLRVEAVAAGSIAADAGFAVGDHLIRIGDTALSDIRFSKIKANGLLFDARGTVAISVQRGVKSHHAAADSKRPLITAAPRSAITAAPLDPVSELKAMLKEPPITAAPARPASAPEPEKPPQRLGSRRGPSPVPPLPFGDAYHAAKREEKREKKRAEAKAAEEALQQAAAKAKEPVAAEAKTAEASTSSSSTNAFVPFVQAQKAADARAAAEAKVAAAMARAAAEAKVAAAAKAAHELRVAQEARSAAEAKAAAMAKAAEAAAARRREAEQAKERQEMEAAAAAAEAAAASARRMEMKAAAANTASTSTASSSVAATTKGKPGTRTFAIGDAVLYDNVRTGRMEMAHVLGVHHEAGAGDPYYTISVGGQERQTEGSRLAPSKGRAALKEIPPFKGGVGSKRARVGHRPGPSPVPSLNLAAHGIGVQKPIRQPFRSQGIGMPMKYA